MSDRRTGPDDRTEFLQSFDHDRIERRIKRVVVEDRLFELKLRLRVRHLGASHFDLSCRHREVGLRNVFIALISRSFVAAISRMSVSSAGDATLLTWIGSMWHSSPAARLR